MAVPVNIKEVFFGRYTVHGGGISMIIEYEDGDTVKIQFSADEAKKLLKDLEEEVEGLG